MDTMALRWSLLSVPVVALLLADTGAQKPFGMEKRVKWTRSRLVGSPDPPPKYRLTRTFNQFVFKEPVFIAQDPRSDRFFVAEYTPGKIYSFRPDDQAGKKDLFLDMKRGISAFSFHPKYVEWPARGHNGGEAIIGPDGYLYITTGDGTSGSDPNGPVKALMTCSRR
jgi:hypothetical protein